MYDTSLACQSLPSEEYIRLLGIAISVFASNNGFIIENIIRTDGSNSWYKLIDLESGRLTPHISKSISERAGNGIEQLFSELVDMRNRILHGFRITSECGEQILGTKDKATQEQFEITEEYLRNFITKNSELSRMLHEYRGY